MNRIILFLLLLPATGFSQNFIGRSKAQVKKYLQRQIAKYDSLTISLTDNDSALLYSIKAGETLPADFIYGFNKSRKCQSERIIAGCDSCFNKFLKKLLSEKKYEWKKINENQYVSKYAARRMIELPPLNNNFSYTILKTDWNKDMYKLLTGH
ncbi:MAG: hypothetical protein SGI96_01705 [Bacteroidota bacterium]|nr:hypothetical protein [Bacteroidota bacterium]